MRTPVYERVIAELEAEGMEIARKIYRVLQDNPDGVSRRELVQLVWGRPARADIGNDTADRKNRATIAAMRARLIPVVSTSGDSGYRLDDSEEARRAMLAEMVSRREKLDEQIKAASMAWRIPVEYADPERAEQLRMI